MNKKGFTLIEVIVSVVLVSIVMVSLTATMVELRKKASTVAQNTNAVIYSSVISRIINEDVIKNNGIKFVNCNANGDECGIVLGNNNKRDIIIKEVTNTNTAKIKKEQVEINEEREVDNNGNLTNRKKKKDRYYLTTESNIYYSDIDVDYGQANTSFDVTTCTNIKLNCSRVYVKDNTCYCVKERVSSSLIYSDTSDETAEIQLGAQVINGHLIYMKTLSYDRTVNPIDNKISTEGFSFSRFNYKQTTYKNVASTATNEVQNILTTFVIGIYDGIDKNDETYNAIVYSASRSNKNSASVGDKYTITLNTTNGLTDLQGVVQPKVLVTGSSPASYFTILRFTEKYNQEFEATNFENGYKQPITRIVPPTAPGKTFAGYYIGNCSGIQIIDSVGTIKVAANNFSSDTTINACWN